MRKYLTVAQGEIVRLDYIVTRSFSMRFARRGSPDAPALLNEVAKATLDFAPPELDNRGLASRRTWRAICPRHDLTPRRSNGPW